MIVRYSLKTQALSTHMDSTKLIWFSAPLQSSSSSSSWIFSNPPSFYFFTYAGVVVGQKLPKFRFGVNHHFHSWLWDSVLEPHNHAEKRGSSLPIYPLYPPSLLKPHPSFFPEKKGGFFFFLDNWTALAPKKPPGSMLAFQGAGRMRDLRPRGKKKKRKEFIESWMLNNVDMH